MGLVLFHLSFMTLASAFVVTATVVARRKKKSWLKFHRLLAVSGVTLALAAAVAMIVFKTVKHYPHFASPHALLGLFAVVLFIAVPAGGILSAQGFSNLRVYHRWGGRAAAVLAITAAASGILRFLFL